MPMLLRRTLKCFYCGQRTSQRYTAGLHQFDCNQCGAQNHLDDAGQITDPPSTPRGESFTYAQATSSQISARQEKPEDSLFCATCLKNQHLFTQTLAEYFPEETHPEYAQFEASYDEYRKRLEQRYPQVCADCEPRVRARMKAASYAAKTDHLRRMTERTKKTWATWRREHVAWRRLLLAVGAVLWWASSLSQILWHVSGAALASDIDEHDFATDDRTGWRRCVLPTQNGWRIRGSCLQAFSPYIDWSLIAALLSFWWNPKLKRKLQGAHVKLTGLSEHFWLQVLVIGFRSGAWWLLRDSVPSDLPPQVFRAVHAVMAVMLVLTGFGSLRTVQVDKTPRVLFSDDIEPLVPTPESKPVLNSQAPYTQEKFQIHQLDPRHRERPPTPPDDTMSETESVAESTATYDSSRMDWTPTFTRSSQLQFTGSASGRTALPNNASESHTISAMPSALGGPSNRPSPFFGSLPAKPPGIAPRGRQVHQPTPFQPPTAEKKHNFFNQMMNESSSSASQGIVSSDALRRKGTDLDLQRPRLPAMFASQLQETGLEELFDRVLVEDQPREVQKAKNERVAQQVASPGIGLRIVIGALFCIVPILIGIWAAGAKTYGWFDGQHRLSSLFFVPWNTSSDSIALE